MNFARTYDRAVGRGPTDEDRAKDEALKNHAEDLKVQTKINWLNDPVTQEVFRGMVQEGTRLVDEAIELASAFHQHQNPHKIVSNLIRAKQLRAILTTIKV